MNTFTKLLLIACIVGLSFFLLSSSSSAPPAPPSAPPVATSPSARDDEEVEPESVAVVGVSALGMNASERAFHRLAWRSATAYCARHKYSCIEVLPPHPPATHHHAEAAAAVVVPGDELGGAHAPHIVAGDAGGEDDHSLPHERAQRRVHRIHREHQLAVQRVADVCHAVWAAMQRERRVAYVLYVGASAVIVNQTRTVAQLVRGLPPSRSVLAGQEYNGHFALVRVDDATRELFRGCAALSDGGVSAVPETAAPCRQMAAAGRAVTINHLINCANAFRVAVQVDPGVSGVFIAPLPSSAAAAALDSGAQLDDEEMALRIRQATHDARAAVPPNRRFEPGKFVATFQQPQCNPLPPARPAARGFVFEMCLRDMREALALATGRRAESFVADAAPLKRRREPDQAHEDARVKANSSAVEFGRDHDPMKVDESNMHHHGAPEETAAPSPPPATLPASPLPTIYPPRQRRRHGPAGGNHAPAGASHPPPLRIAIMMVVDYRDDQRARSFSEELVFRCTQFGFINKAAYAALWGYDLILENGRVIDPEQRKHAAYAKLGALIKWLPQYDWIFMTDADTLIMNYSLTIEHHVLERAARIKRRQAQRVAGAGTDSRPSLRSDDNFDFIATQDWNGLNTGLVFWRNTPWSLDFLRRADEMSPHALQCEHIPLGFYEQRNIMCLLDQTKHPRAREDHAHVKIFRTQRLFNSYARLTSAGHEDSVFMPGDFAVHLPNLKSFQRGLTHFKNKYVLAVKLNGGVPLQQADEIKPPRAFYPSDMARIEQFLGGRAIGPLLHDEEPQPNDADPREFAARMKARLPKSSAGGKSLKN